LRPRAPGTSETRLRFTHAVIAASERLVLARRVADDDGRELAPSPYWMETCRVIGRDPEQLDRRTGARGDVLDERDVAPTEREALRRLAAGGYVASGLLTSAAPRRTRVLGVPMGGFDDVSEVTVTSLDAFLRCPYGWFFDRYLAPRPLEPELDAAFEGSPAHSVLHGLYKELYEEGVGPCRRDTLHR